MRILKVLVLGHLAVFAPVATQAAHALDGRDTDAGQALYAEHCASCHGAHLEGAPDWQIANSDGTMPAPPHDETGHTWHHGMDLLFEYTSQGGAAVMAERGITSFKSAMPAFENVLTEGQIWDVLAYIRSTWPTRVQDIQAARTAPH